MTAALHRHHHRRGLEVTNTDRFVSTPGDVGHADEELPLVSVRDLARHLGVERQSKARRHAAIRAWLRDHTPNDLLAQSLELEGLLPHRV